MKTGRTSGASARPGVWLVGLLAQVALAILLMLKQQISEIR